MKLEEKLLEEYHLKFYPMEPKGEYTKERGDKDWLTHAFQEVKNSERKEILHIANQIHHDMGGWYEFLQYLSHLTKDEHD